MPPVQKVTPKVAEKDLLPIGSVVSLVSGGRTLPGYEVVDKDSRFVKFRASLQIAPMTDYVLVPYEQLEMVGLPRV
jgi:hypothetical protein